MNKCYSNNLKYFLYKLLDKVEKMCYTVSVKTERKPSHEEIVIQSDADG